MLARVSIAILTVSPSVALAMCMEYISEDKNDVGKMFFETMIPSLSAAIVVFFVNDWIYVKLGLLKMVDKDADNDSGLQ